MGYSQAQKEKTHQRIVAIASKRFREKGPRGARNCGFDGGSRADGGRLLQALRLS